MPNLLLRALRGLCDLRVKPELSALHLLAVSCTNLHKKIFMETRQHTASHKKNGIV